MSTQVKIPAMGESISSGILAAWHVADGDYVHKDQLIYELETDKITSEANATVAGIITLHVAADDAVEIGQIVATIDESARAPADTSPPAPADTSPPAAAATADPPPTTAPLEPAASAAPAIQPTVAQPASSVPTHPLSPAARKVAAETGIDPAHLTGSGKDGRVSKSDILAAADAAPAALEPSRMTAPKQTADSVDPATRETRKKMSPLRAKIAEHLVRATQECALLTTFNEVDMSQIIHLRKQHQDAFVARHGIKLGFMSFFTKAVTQALQIVPAVNARIEGDEIITQHFYDIGVAVGTDKGLMVPIIRNCDQKSFAEIEQDILDYAQAARAGKIQMSDLNGGVFTISNGGIYGSMLSTPIINYPQPAILGLHNITERAVVVECEIVIRPMMYLALSYDHRLIDGQQAVTFLNQIKRAIEAPSRLLFNI